MKGTVTAIIFEGSENFKICAIQSNDIPREYQNKIPNEVIVKGSMSVVLNLSYNFEGKWTKHDVYGWQMSVSSYEEIVPDGSDIYAIMTYLSSGLFNGIGPVMAKRIVSKFGKDTLDIFKKNPERLLEVRGISKVTLQKILQSYIENQQYQEIMLLLKPYGLGTKRILKIVEEYKGKAIEELKSNPYGVCKRIDGFGFLTADKLAMACGIHRRDENRVQEGIKYVLENAAQEKGNLFLDKNMLGQNLSKILNNDLQKYSYEELQRRGCVEITKEKVREEIFANFVNETDVYKALQSLCDNDEIMLEYHTLHISNDISIDDTHIIPNGSDVEVLKFDNNDSFIVKYDGKQYSIKHNLIKDIDFDCYLMKYYIAENHIAENINRILYSTKRKSLISSFSTVIQDLEKKNNIQYAQKQKEAIMSAIRRNFLVITGGPGTGKTTLIKGIISLFDMIIPNNRIVLAAPTGRAAKRMEESTGVEASTIHRLLEYNRNGGFSRDKYNPIDADVVIIDETSMVDVLLMNALMNAVADNTKIIFVGDADQLPSVGPGMILRDMIATNKIPTIFLNEIFRQTNTSKIVINAQKINNGETDLEYGEDFMFHSIKDANNVQEETLRVLCDIYKRELTANNNDVNKVQVLVPFRVKKIISAIELNKVLAPIANPRPKGEICIPFGDNTYHIGDKVMQLKNNYDKQVFNGDIGFIKNIEKGSNGYSMVIDFDGRYILYEDFDELTLAYATTIHKSQGSEYDVVIEPILNEQYIFLQRCMTYTAVTRAKKKYIGIGEPKALMTSIANNKIINRNTKLTQRIDSYTI